MYLNKLGLSSPWCTYYKKINELFKDDPEIHIEYDNDAPSIKLFVDNAKKAAALTKLIPDQRTFGNVVLNIYVIPADNEDDITTDDIKAAFEGNPAFSYLGVRDLPMTPPANFVVFKNKVVQFFNDDLTDINGNCSTLYQNIAFEVLNVPKNTYFCTDVETNPGVQGEAWYKKNL